MSASKDNTLASFRGCDRRTSGGNEARGAAGIAAVISETSAASGRERCAPPTTVPGHVVPRQAFNSTVQNVAFSEYPASADHENETSQPYLSENCTMPQTNSTPSSRQRLFDPTAGATGPTAEPKGISPGNDDNAHGHFADRLPRSPSTSLRSPLTHPNGVLIFPDLSAEQQVSEWSDATTQAETTIVADSDELASLFTATDSSDAGYETDSVTNASTSIESSVRDFMYENGRRYHRFREGLYNFPNDEIEQEREDMKHAMVKLLCSERLNFAPIGDNPHEILDIGTGTGVWAIEMGDRYPSATVLGVDLSPIQPDWVPPNVRFEVDDAESAWLYKRDHFDYIHSRHTVMAVKDWRTLFRRAMEHLKPGGWIELQEIHHFPSSANNSMSAAHPVAQYWSFVGEGLSNLGVDLNAAGGDQLPNMLRDAGFANVTERVFHVPIGTWPRNRVLKTVGMYWRTILLDGLQAIALGPFTRGLRWSVERTELFLVDVRRAYQDNSVLMYMPFRVMYAQKPSNPER